MAQPRFNRFDRYLITGMKGPFFGAAAVFLILFLIFQSLRLAQFLISQQASLRATGLIVLWLILSFAHLVVPVACLAAGLIGLNEMKADGELAAMQSLGISLRRLRRWPLVISLGLAGLTVAASWSLAPLAERKLAETVVAISSARTSSQLVPRQFNRDFFNLVLYAEEVDPESQELRNVFIYDDRYPERPSVIVAARGDIHAVLRDNSVLPEVALILRDGASYNTSARSDLISEKVRFARNTLYFRSSAVGSLELEEPRMLAGSELLSKMSQGLHEPGRATSKDYEIEFWKRMALSIGAVVFTFLSTAWGPRSVRGGSTAILLTLAIVAAYWLCLATGALLAKQDLLPPFMTMQLGNLLGASLAWNAVRKERAPSS